MVAKMSKNKLYRKLKRLKRENENIFYAFMGITALSDTKKATKLCNLFGVKTLKQQNEEEKGGKNDTKTD